MKSRLSRIFNLRGLATISALVAALGACASVWAQDSPRVQELLGDLNFERGFHVTSSNVFLGDFRLPFAGEQQPAAELEPTWGLATHASKYNISKGEFVSEEKYAAVTTPGQIVSLTKDDEGVVTLKLGVKTENEYSAPRRADQLWIHLLITRDFEEEERVAFEDVDSVVFSCDARVPYVEKTDPNNAYDSGLHTTQASVYFSLPNGNPDSEDYRDYIWFGVSFYDERYEIQTDYVAVDGDPKTIGTGKLIYRLGEQKSIDDLLGGVNPYSNEWVHVEFDVKKFLPDAIKAAHEKGFLIHSKPEDFVVAHFNFGWETPGTYASDLEIKNLKLLATFKEKNK